MLFNLVALLANAIALIVVACEYYISPYWYLIGFVIFCTVHIMFNIFVLTTNVEAKKFVIKYRWYLVFGESIFIMILALACFIDCFVLLA